MLSRRILFLAALLLLAPLGCGEPVNPLSVEDLGSLMKSGASFAVFDANGDKIRKEYGVIPGAKLLDSAADYDLGVMPSDKAAKLVFYCSSSWCSAAGTAAKRARTGGYSDVNVLPAGIKGWKAAGKTTDEI